MSLAEGILMVAREQPAIWWSHVLFRVRRRQRTVLGLWLFRSSCDAGEDAEAHQTPAGPRAILRERGLE